MQSESREKYVIFVNKKQVEVSQSTLTGRQILQDASYDPGQYDLFLVKGQTSEQIGLDQTVEIKNGLHFNAILKSVPYG